MKTFIIINLLVVFCLPVHASCNSACSLYHFFLSVLKLKLSHRLQMPSSALFGIQHEALFSVSEGMDTGTSWFVVCSFHKYCTTSPLGLLEHAD